MRIGVNLLPVVPGIGGSWHYIANLLAALAEHDEENEYVAFVTNASASILPKGGRFAKVHVSLPASNRPLRVAYENSLFALEVRKHRLDIMHHMFGTLPLFGHKRTVVTVHDLMVFARPRDLSTTKREYLRLMRWRVANRATVLSPVSHATAETLRDWMGVPSERMHVVRAAMPWSFTRSTAQDVASFRAAKDLPAEYWLCVAGDYPHKNFLRLIEAFARLRAHRPGWPMVIRGIEAPDLLRRIADVGISSQVRFIPWLSDDEMPLLYSAASALVFPSLFEGGGLPVIEAMACGCPVVASDLPTTREFASDAAFTFDPGSISDMVRAMSDVEGSPAMREQRRLAGIARAVHFRPVNTAHACLEAYAAAFSSGGAAS